MKLICPAVVAMLAIAGPALAQSVLTPGRTTSGELSSSDNALEDGSFYDCFTLRTEPGQRYQVELRSPDFDAFLALGAADCSGSLDETDDDGAGGTDSRVEFTGDGRPMTVRANSLSEGETGRYTLSVTALGPERRIKPASIDWGQTRRGDLSGSDAVADDDSFYDCYAFSGTGGQRAVIELASEDFDTYLSLHQGEDCRGAQVESNDDGPDNGTDSRLELSLPATGAYSIRANSLGSGETGAYTLTLSR